MRNSKCCSAAWTWFIAALFALSGSIPLLQAEEGSKQQYSETIAVLQLLHSAEVRAQHRYLAFTKVAISDGHINIAHLFKALAASEAVHARNFKRILGTLGAEVINVELSSITVSTTKENLKFATQVELSEIDIEYPRYIKRITTEAHKEAVKYIKYAWKAEHQHRDLIKEIQSGTGIFFSMLLKRFRNRDSRYYVCQNCGSTITALPVDACPICYKPLDIYLEISAP